MATPTGNPYLEGNFAPVRQEATVFDLPVTGTLPAFLDGRYLRNGPNPVTDVDPSTYHWFTGSGMVHGIRIGDGRAQWYRNRSVRSKDVATALGEPPRSGPVHAGMDFSPNTNVIGHAGRTFALVEAGGRPYELDDECNTIGPCDFDGTLPGGYTAHPLRDPATGELHALSYYWGWGNRVQYSVLGIDARIRRTVDIAVGESPMMHAFSLTQRHVIIYDLPVTFDLAGNTEFPYSWNPDYRARIGVLPRDGDAADVRWLDVEPCYVYHPLNAFDDEDRIVIDVTRHPKMFATDHRGPNEGPPTLDRWTADLSAGKVIEERLDDRGQEFPRIDERLIGQRHRFGYTIVFDEPETSHVLLKHDFVRGNTTARSLGGQSEADEFVFVPARVDADEDDGALLGFVYDRVDDRSDLVVLDAETLDTMASIHLPCRVPHGFHGNWVPSWPERSPR